MNPIPDEGMFQNWFIHLKKISACNVCTSGLLDNCPFKLDNFYDCIDKVVLDSYIVLHPEWQSNL